MSIASTPYSTSAAQPSASYIAQRLSGRQCSAGPLNCQPQHGRQRRAAAGQRAQALFGFGKQKAEPAPSPAPTVAFVPYQIVKKEEGGLQLRLYQPYAVAECTYERRDEGFLALGSYMSGSNSEGSKFREAQPIVMCYPPQGEKRMQVYLEPRDGGAVSVAELPDPSNPAVSLRVAGGELIAAWRFEGNATQEACERARQRLLAAVQQAGLKLGAAEAEGFFRLAQYGPLHSLSTRVNEIWLTVSVS